ncbi:cyclodeaminase [Roseisalinus antarcticus]|uniref:L-lysine cyclodeaminase n=1 Tax=Roseisalinus antarcticus TaxID=254357 RepID=A0A1Y5SJQ7_9RHOB|nr:cyclodeaminase [Roseisalinus antarcticus]SLN42436.1 L-lysine cyclodeaminase [Roseisalinus antarcticus]
MPADILIATEAELRAALPLDLAAIDCVESAFAALAGDGVVMPPVLSMALPAVNGEVDVKTAYLPGFEGFAIKVSPGFFDNPGLGLPSLNGLMLLFSARTGVAQAVFLDNGYLTDLRTAAAGAVAARHLAPRDVRTAGVLGTGAQARLQMQAAHLVRPFERVLVWGRDPERAAACARDIAAATGATADVAEDIPTLMAQSQLVVTTTPSEQPLIRAEWLHPGVHITAMGSDQQGKTEVAPEALAAADLYVADRVSQCAVMGELRGARAAGLMTGDPPELGQIVTGQAAGRQSADAVTVCDLTGTGAQDTAIATRALAAMRQTRGGTTISA